MAIMVCLPYPAMSCTNGNGRQSTNLNALKMQDLSFRSKEAFVWQETRRGQRDAPLAPPFGHAGNPSYCSSVRERARKSYEKARKEKGRESASLISPSEGFRLQNLLDMVPRPGMRIGKVLGIPIFLHSTWIIIFAGITYSLAMQFTQQFPRWTPAQQWSVGVFTSILFFASLLFHELAHSVVAQHYKIRVLSITLFIFGGVASIERDPSKAIQEFNIAIAGPLASGFLAGLFFGLLQLFPSNQMVSAVSTWLWTTNLLLAVFNLLPGFPLDGGRIFRAIIWGATKNFSKATRVAGASGRMIAYAMILVGGFAVFKGFIGQGLWSVFIGFFLLNAAQESVAQAAIRETLSGLRAADVMSQEVPTVGRAMSLEEYGAEVLRTGRRCHLVITDDRLVGMMNVHTLNSVPREEWAHNSVQAVMIPRERILWATPDEPLIGLLERLLTADVNQMPIVSGSDDGAAHIIGMVSRDSILRVMQTRTELGPFSFGAASK
jgi:Zn-dependent protease